MDVRRRQQARIGRSARLRECELAVNTQRVFGDSEHVPGQVVATRLSNTTRNWVICTIDRQPCSTQLRRDGDLRTYLAIPSPVSSPARRRESGAAWRPGGGRPPEA